MKPTLLFGGLIALLTTISCQQNTPAVPTATGVWANADCEMLRTERFVLFFERQDSILTATLHQMDAGDTLLLGKVTFSPDSILGQYIAKQGDAQQPADLGTLQPDGSLRVAINGREQVLRKIEQITVCPPYQMLEASPLETGSCVQQWTSGVKVGGNDTQLSFEAGTNRHNYAFYIMPQMVYCRAARMRFNDHGGLFAQNIRMMANTNTGEHTCEMEADNEAVSAKPLTIDNSKFSPDQCVFDTDGIYWSFIRFDGNTAEINGCGEIYRYPRPEVGEQTLTEWIAFEKY